MKTRAEYEAKLKLLLTFPNAVIVHAENFNKHNKKALNYTYT